MSNCRNCGREIDWAYTAKGKAVPIDPEPVFVIEGDGKDLFYTAEDDVMIGRTARPGEEHHRLPVGFVPHWRTCQSVRGQ